MKTTNQNTQKKRAQKRPKGRTLTGLNLRLDEKNKRFIVYRRGGGAERKTSVRFGKTISREQAFLSAQILAGKIRSCPESKLKSFKW